MKALVLVVALALAPPAAADLWQPPAEAEATLLEKGDALLLRSLETRDEGDHLKARRLAYRAVEAYEEAAREPAHAAEAHFRAAEVLYAYFIANVNHPDVRTTLRAIGHWEAFTSARLDDPRLQSVLFRRSIARTKLAGDEHLRRALDDYAALQSLSPASDRELPTILSNAAEIHMTLGDLDTAIDLYQEALGLQNDPLYGYGLAVALDRDGQEIKAREIMATYAGSDRLFALTKSGVFFIPSGDIHYYLGLGFESLGHHRQAAEQYRAFLDLLPNSRYAPRARSHLGRVVGRADDDDARPRRELPGWRRWSR